jgi:hypothetical protein
LRVLWNTEGAQLDQGVSQQLHPIGPLLNALKTKEQPLEFVFPRKGPIDTRPQRMELIASFTNGPNLL